MLAFAHLELNNKKDVSSALKKNRCSQILSNSKVISIKELDLKKK